MPVERPARERPASELRLVAHRGHAQRFPENSIPGLHSAFESGADDVEIDIQLTRDGVAVLYHDDTLDRVSGLSGSLLELTAEAALALPADEPARFGDQFSALRITPLTALCDVIAAHPSATLFAEIKEESLRHHDRETLVDTVLTVLQPIREQVTVISYDTDILRLARARGRPIGWVVSRYDAAHRATLDELDPDVAIVNHLKITGDLWPGGWSWMVYEVTDAPLARSLAARGVSYIETMAVAQLRAALR